MSSVFGFIKELTEKDHTPTPSYVFDLDKMKGFVKKSAELSWRECTVMLCYEGKPVSYRSNDGGGFFV